MENLTFYWTNDSEGVSEIGLWVFVLLVCPLGLLSIVGNVLVLVCVCRERKLHRPSYYLVGALALADVSVPVVGTGPAGYITLVHTASTCTPLARFLFSLPLAITTGSSFGHLILLFVERYCSVAHPIAHRKVVTTRRTALASLAIWISCSLYNMTYLSFSNRPRDPSWPICAPLSFEMSVASTISGVLGLACVTTLNVHLMVLIRKRVRVEDHNRCAAPRPDRVFNNPENARNHAINMSIIIIMFYFILCWLPITMIFALEALNYHVEIQPVLLGVCRLLFVPILSLNGAINPIVYARSNPNLRTAFRRLFRRFTNRTDAESLTLS